MKKSKLFASMFVIMSFGIITGKFISNYSIDEIKDDLFKTKEEIKTEKIDKPLNKSTSTSVVETKVDTDNYTIIDDVSDFAKMNGSSGKFAMTKNITIPSGTTSLGIETFSGVFDGGGYTISNLSGPLVKTLTGTIYNLVISSPRTYVADTTLNKATINFSNTYYNYLTGDASDYIACQYFGYVCGKVTSGVIDNVKVTGATIDTNSGTQSDFTGDTNGYMGFIAGYSERTSIIKNCTVEYSTLVHSSSYAVGGIVGYSSDSDIYGCLVRELTISGKNGVAISSMPKAFTGLIAGVFNFGGYIWKSVIADIKQGNSPYLSMVGAVTHTLNAGNFSIKNISYDETVADYSTVSNTIDTYERVLISDDPLTASNVTCNSYGHVYDTDASSLGYKHIVKISNIRTYTSSLSTMISDMNSIISSGEHSLKRSTSHFGVDNYVSKKDKIVAVNYSVASKITYGDYIKDVIDVSLNEARTNFDTKLLLQYKYDDYSNYSAVDEDRYFYKIGSGSWKVMYYLDSNWINLEGASGTFEVQPFDLKDAVVTSSPINYNGSPKSPTFMVRTPNKNVNFYSSDYTISGTTNATEVGQYEVTITGNGTNCVGSIKATWSINPGNMSASASNISKIYNGSNHQIDVSAPSGSTIYYSLDQANYTLTHPEIKNAGTHTIYYKVSKDNYNDYFGSAIITIKPVTVTVSWGNTSLQYNGEYQLPTYTLEGICEGDDIEVTEIIGSASRVGNNYTAKVISITDNPNYVLTSYNSEKSTTFKITPIYIKSPTISSKEYTGEVLYADIDLNGKYVIEGSYYGTDVGEYKFTLTPFSNHAWENGNTYTLSYTFTIIKATNHWISEPTIEGWTYGQQPNHPIYEAKIGTAKFEYRLKGTTQYLNSIPTDAGTYEVLVTISNNNVSNVLTKTLEFTIEKATPPYTIPSELSANYGDKLINVALPFDNNGAWTFKDSPYTLVGDAGVNTFTVIYTHIDTNNYNIVEKQVNIVVNKIDATYTAPTAKNDLVYKGDLQELINEGSTSDGIMEYKVDDGVWSTTIPSCVEAKKYVVYYRLIGDANHNDVQETTINVEIKPLEVVINSVLINDVHLSDNKYTLSINNIDSSVKIDSSSFEIVNYTFVTSNQPGTQEVELTINILDSNYVLTNNKIKTSIVINNHEANEDDNDCTTKVTCKHCDAVVIEANTSHESNEDDGNCTTKVTCKHCDYVFVEANDSHESNEDDNNCETEVTCKHCEYVFVEAKTHNLSSNYKKDKDGHYTNCVNDDCNYVTNKENHVSSGQATSENAEICTVCKYIITPTIGHVHESKNTMSSDDTYHWYECTGCEEQLEKQEHSFYAHTKIDDDTHLSKCVCGKEKENKHSYGEFVITTLPDKTTQGIKTKTCDCGHTITETIPPTGNEGLSTGAIIAIVVGSVSLIGLLVFVIYWFIIKKKNFNDIMKVFKK